MTAYFNGPATKEGGGGKVLATQKDTVFWSSKNNSGKKIVAGPLKKIQLFFCSFPYVNIIEIPVDKTIEPDTT